MVFESKSFAMESGHANKSCFWDLPYRFSGGGFGSPKAGAKGRNGASLSPLQLDASPLIITIKNHQESS